MMEGTSFLFKKKQTYIVKDCVRTATFIADKTTHLIQQHSQASQNPAAAQTNLSTQSHMTRNPCICKSHY